MVEFVGLGAIPIIMIIVVTILVAQASSRSHRSPPPHRAPPPPPPGMLRRPPPVFVRRRRPTVSPGHLVVSVLFAPFVLLIWGMASIGDAIAAPVHLAVGVLLTCLSLVSGAVGGSPRKMWRSAGRQFLRSGRALWSMTYRLFSFFGLGGVMDRLRESIVPEPPPRPVHRAAPTVSSKRLYPFEDRYRIESHLGSGGSTARLFVVRRMEGITPVGDRLVLKYFDMGMGSRLEEVIRESRGMQVAKDMGIVLDHRLEQDHFYYVMPYYEGETLTRASARLHRHLTAEEGLEHEHVEVCLGWMSELLRILDGYHRHGVIHKDVKPDNVIVTDQGIRLVDLGLLTPLASALTLTTHGTEYFRDPEMVKLAVQGKRVKDVEAVRFDVYSSGAVLFLLLEGSFPACGPLSRFSKPVPMVISWITSRAMAEGKKRYPSVAAMRADLEAVAAMAAEGVLDDVPVSRLPSFGGFDAVPVFEDDTPLMPAAGPAAPAAMPRAPARAPSVFAPEPPRKSGGVVPAVVAIVLLGGLTLVGLAVLAWFVAPAGNPRVAISDRPATLARTAPPTSHPKLEADVIARDVLQWKARIAEEIELYDPEADLADVPVLVVPDDGAAFQEAGRAVRRELQKRGIAVYPSGSLARRVRAYLDPDEPAGDRTDQLLENFFAEDSLPFVLWIRDAGFDVGNDLRFADVHLYYSTSERVRRFLVPREGDR